ncbi:MAG: LuxR family transcriptional regulator [Deltaproteobacteria bacterium]|jgi:DNA-binding CsgD family transcriptional regulator|nr:MAG: LuxR family transcriptional regulator [Deltaproteobacteria bacterium]
MDKPVTAREREILELISQGFSTKEIAYRLYISEETVKSHRHHLFNKFSARNSPHLIQKALCEGVLKDVITTAFDQNHLKG